MNKYEITDEHYGWGVVEANSIDEIIDDMRAILTQWAEDSDEVVSGDVSLAEMLELYEADVRSSCVLVGRG